MRALRYHAFGGPEAAVLEEIEAPVPREGEVRVRVRAAALNPIDTKILRGEVAAAQPPRTLGVDFAGEIEGTGERVFGSGAGFGVRADGACAEYVCAPRVTLATAPEGMPFAQAAALGVVCLTAELCVEKAAAGAGQALLVLGAGGAVGSLCVQFGRAAGARVIALVSGEAGAARARALGAAEAVDRARADWPEAVRALTAGRGVDAVVDVVGGRFFEAGVGLLAPGGRLLSVGVSGEPARAALDLPAFYRKGALILGVNTSLLGAAERGQRLARMAARISRGEVTPPEVEEMPLERGVEALRRVASFATGGKKLVLLP